MCLTLGSFWFQDCYLVFWVEMSMSVCNSDSKQNNQNEVLEGRRLRSELKQTFLWKGKINNLGDQAPQVWPQFFNLGLPNLVKIENGDVPLSDFYCERFWSCPCLDVVQSLDFDRFCVCNGDVTKKWTLGWRRLQWRGWKCGAPRQRWSSLWRWKFWAVCDTKICWYCGATVLRARNGWLCMITCPSSAFSPTCTASLLQTLLLTGNAGWKLPLDPQKPSRKWSTYIKPLVIRSKAVHLIKLTYYL